MAVKLTLVHVIAVSTVVTVGFLLMYWKMRGLERSVALAQASASQALALAQEAQARLQTEGVCEEGAAAACSAESSSNSRDAELVRSVVTEESAEDGMSVCSADVDEVLRSMCSVPSPGSATSSVEAPTQEEQPPAPEESEVAVPSSRASHEDEFTLSFAQKGESIEDELRKKTLEELRALLKSMNLSAKGNKAELIARALSASA